MNTGNISLEGTLIEEILKTDPKKFKPLNTQGRRPPKKKDVLGVLNDFERACIALWQQKKAKHHDYHMLEGEGPKCKEHVLIHDEMEMLQQLMWNSVGRRMPHNEKTTGFKIYGDQVIQNFEQAPGPLPPGLMFMLV